MIINLIVCTDKIKQQKWNNSEKKKQPKLIHGLHTLLFYLQYLRDKNKNVLYLYVSQCKIIYIHVDRSKCIYYVSNNECAPGLSRQNREICPEDDYMRSKRKRRRILIPIYILFRNARGRTTTQRVVSDRARAPPPPPRADILTACPTARKTRDANYG